MRDPATKAVTGVKLVATSTNLASSVTHRPWGPWSGATFGNGSVVQRGFNKRYEPTTISSGPISLTFSPSASGNVGSVSGSVAATFTYDKLDRLRRSTNAYAGVESLWFAYSAAGGRVTKGSTDASGVQVAKYAFGYDNQSNLSSVSQYDAAGSALVKTICLKHDALGRLAVAGEGATSNGGPDVLGCTRESDVTGTATRFSYDAFGRRAARRDGTNAWRYFVHDSSGRLLLEATRNGTGWVFTREYVWLDDTPLAQIEGGATYYYHPDGTGQPLALTNASRQTVWSATREPWGNVAESGTSVVTNLRLPGQYDEKLLASVGLQGPYYNWHRWYLPSAGRYLEPDPIAKAGELNAGWRLDWYGYVDQSPLRWIDPEGQSKYDKLFGFPRKFWRWLHKHPQYMKKPGEPDFDDIEELRSLHEEWLKLGKPGPGETLWEWLFPYPDLFVNPCLISPDLCGAKRDECGFT